MAENKKNIPDAGKADEPPKLGKVEPAKAAPPVQEQPTPAKAEAPVVEDASKVVKPPTAEQPDKLVTCPSGPPPPRERHAEYCCLMTGQGNGRGAPKTFIKEETIPNWRSCLPSRGATTPAVAMSSMLWKTAGFLPQTSGVWWPSSFSTSRFIRRSKRTALPISG